MHYDDQIIKEINELCIIIYKHGPKPYDYELTSIHKCFLIDPRSLYKFLEKIIRNNGKGTIIEKALLKFPEENYYLIKLKEDNEGNLIYTNVICVENKNILTLH